MGINAGVQQYGLQYGRFMHGVVRGNLALNRKMLSELAANEPFSFKAVVSYVLGFVRTKKTKLPKQQEQQEQQEQPNNPPSLGQPSTNKPQNTHNKQY